MHIEEIKKLLRNTDVPMADIAKQFKVSARTVSNINNGNTYKEENINYPLRISGKRIYELKRKLSIPNKKAVPNPHVLSPQLLDYIGFLSLLEVSEDCLLEFKEVYNKQLTKHFGKNLSNTEILSVISLRPTRPRQLKELLNAYDNPKVKMINTDYWLKQGLIKKGEEEVLNFLLLKR